MGNAEQLGLFPEASEHEIEKTKAYMEQYREAKAKVESFPDKATDELKAILSDIERSVSIILDEEVKRVIEYRYIQGNVYTATIQYFSNRGWSKSAVDRRLNSGLKTLAETLLFCGQLST
ncbi:hypothetical protein [Paenibacillus thermotolerans]|uniref:hypothetical protein n=1 Tax=Paenibacillus thermotolerans TaxID=3027807 RepID=UPI002368BDC0|nr:MULTISPECIES: hypothetical protein [unclassified Paenibacillus]